MYLPYFLRHRNSMSLFSIPLPHFLIIACAVYIPLGLSLPTRLLPPELVIGISKTLPGPAVPSHTRRDLSDCSQLPVLLPKCSPDFGPVTSLLWTQRLYLSLKAQS